VLKVAGVRRGYRFAHRPAAVETVVETIVQRFATAERRDIERIAQVVALAASPDCTVRQVLTYFGEQLEHDCGHCDRCLGEAIPPMAPRHDEILTEGDRALIAAVVAEGHTALQAPRQVARFLCGLTSPAASRARLGRDPRFGQLSHHRFAAIAEAASSLAG
jgi:ATP-dependent DNA helicase RecQ